MIVQLTNHADTLLYDTLQYLTVPTIPILPYNFNKYCDPIGHSEAQNCDKRSEIVDLQLTNQIDSWPTLPYNTLQYLHYHNNI